MLEMEKMFPPDSMTVMIVDDTQPNVLILQRALTNTGYNISVAFSGEKALELIPKLKPDLILLDVMMPGINGFEVCKLLKKDVELKSIPVIFITAMGMPEDVLKGFEAGAVDYITKPFNLQEVCVRVKTHLILSAAINKLIQDSETDSLTGLFNRRTFLKKVENEAMRFKRSKKSFSLLFADIDFFKKINDTYGHAAGDEILINISNILNTEKREVDQVGRWGGEEFLLLLPETNIEGAVQHGNKIRELISEKPIMYEGQEIHITMSFGVSEYSEDINIEKTIDQADQRLYIAKNSGRNKVVSEDA